MRVLRTLLGIIVLVALVVGIGALFSANAGGTTLSLGTMTLQASIGAIVAGAVVLGFVVAALLLLPGRLSAGAQRQRLARAHHQTADELAALRQQHAQLQDAHQRLLAGSQSAPVDATATLPAASGAPAMTTEGGATAGSGAQAPALPAYGSSYSPPYTAEPYTSAYTSAAGASASATPAAPARAPVMPGSLRIGSIAGIQIDIHVSL